MWSKRYDERDAQNQRGRETDGVPRADLTHPGRGTRYATTVAVLHLQP